VVDRPYALAENSLSPSRGATGISDVSMYASPKPAARRRQWWLIVALLHVHGKLSVAVLVSVLVLLSRGQDTSISISSRCVGLIVLGPPARLPRKPTGPPRAGCISNCHCSTEKRGKEEKRAVMSARVVWNMMCDYRLMSTIETTDRVEQNCVFEEPSIQGHNRNRTNPRTEW